MPTPDPRDFSLSPRQCERLLKALLPGEELRWSGRPVPQLWTVDAVMATMGGVVALGIAIGWLCFAWPRSWELALCSLPVWAGALLLLSAPWRWCHRQKRSLLLLTNQRVMVVTPGCSGRLQMDGWMLKSGLLKRYTVQEDGSGDLIFGYNAQFRCRWGKVPFGLQAVPQVELVAQLIQELCNKE